MCPPEARSVLEKAWLGQETEEEKKKLHTHVIMPLVEQHAESAISKSLSSLQRRLRNIARRFIACSVQDVPFNCGHASAFG